MKKRVYGAVINGKAHILAYVNGERHAVELRLVLQVIK